jgi:hypothetical protein
MELHLGNRRVRVSPKTAIGKGGEADIYDLGDGRALKVFKTERHPDLAGQPQEQQAARARLSLQQRKLPAFPRALPKEIVAPGELALDSRGHIAGYAMPLIAGAEPLLRFGEPAFRRAGATSALVAELFRSLHTTLTALHAKGVLIGDFNDLNLLVPDRATAPLLIDADSFQFANFPCLAFTERFLDPRLAGPNAQQLFPTAPYDLASDWFAFAALLTQSLLCIGPWAGIHRPPAPQPASPAKRRALERISIFRDDVQLAPSAVPRDSLPDDLLHELAAIFNRDERRPLPRALLERLDFRVCASCSLEHARAACPRCHPHAAAPLKQVATAHGSVLAKMLFESRGTILAASRDDRLRLLEHDGKAYRREDGSIVLEGPADARLQLALLGEATLVARDGRLVLLAKHQAPRALQADLCEGKPTFAAQGERLVWSSGGQLLSAKVNQLIDSDRGLQLPPLVLGSLLGQGTRLWLGPEFGLGLTRAGELTQAFTFAPERRGIDDSMKLPGGSYLGGHLLRTRCAFGKDRAWLLLAMRQQQKTVHRCLLLSSRGAVLAEAEAEEDDGSWLGQFPNLCAVGELLFAATDDGLLRVKANQGHLGDLKRFPDPAPFVDRETQLFFSGEALLAVTARCARELRLQ